MINVYMLINPVIYKMSDTKVQNIIYKRENWKMEKLGHIFVEKSQIVSNQLSVD